MEVFPGISMDPAIRFGKTCLVGGTLVVVATTIFQSGVFWSYLRRSCMCRLSPRR
jgi:hypothetical protein